MKSSRNPAALSHFLLPLAAAACLVGTSSSASADAGSAAAPGIYALLKGGALHSVGDEGLRALPIRPGVVRFAVEGGTVFYVRAEGGRTYCGRWNPDEAGPIELPLDGAGTAPERLRGSGATLYALYGPFENGGGTLYSAKLNEGIILEARGVVDFTLYDGRPVVLEREDSGFRCVIGDSRVHLALEGGAVFRDGTDGRLLVVSDGERTEVVDAATARVVYRYAGTVVYRAPDDHNLELEAVDDTPGPPSGKTLFYRITINGTEAGRTDTGPAETRRVFRHSVPAGEYLVVAAERWELNLKKERYERANNILQPDPIRLFVPEGLILKVSISYDGRSYRTTAAPLTDPLLP